MSTVSGDLPQPYLAAPLVAESRERFGSYNEGVVGVEALVAVWVQLVEKLACDYSSHSRIGSG